MDPTVDVLDDGAALFGRPQLLAVLTALIVDGKASPTRSVAAGLSVVYSRETHYPRYART